MRIRKIAQTPGTVATVVDNLASESAVDALSAKQGKELKQMIEDVESSLIDGSLETFPIGTVVKYDGENIPEGWEKVENTTIASIGGANYIQGSEKAELMKRPDTYYHRAWRTVKHDRVLKTDSVDHVYTLSFRFIPEQEGFIPASSIVVGGKRNADPWDIRLWPSYNNWQVEHYNDYDLYSITFTILGDGNQYLQDHVGFILESGVEGTGGIISHLKLEEGNTRTDWTPYYEDIEVAISSTQPFLNKNNVWIRNSKNLFNKNDHIIKSRQSIISADFNGWYNTDFGGYTLQMRCKPNTTYTISQLLDTSYTFAVATSSVNDANSSEFSNIQQSNSSNIYSNRNYITITTNSSDKYLYISIWENKTSNITLEEALNSLQVEFGSNPTDYEEFVDENIFIKDYDNSYKELDMVRYSLVQEQRIGTWINGKPIYQKTIEVPSLPNNGVVQHAHGIANVDKIWIDLANSFQVNGSETIPMVNIWSNGVDERIGIVAEGTNIFINTNCDYHLRSAIITLRYTKTTD